VESVWKGWSLSCHKGSWADQWFWRKKLLGLW
jgi:hypothetical protein